VDSYSSFDMLSTLNLWIFLLPSLLVVGTPTTLSPGDTGLAKVRQAFETFNVSSLVTSSHCQQALTKNLNLDIF
jgi:hypothetical protein